MLEVGPSPPWSWHVVVCVVFRDEGSTLSKSLDIRRNLLCPPWPVGPSVCCNQGVTRFGDVLTSAAAFAPKMSTNRPDSKDCLLVVYLILQLCSQ